MRNQRKESLVRVAVLFGCSFVGAMLGCVVKWLLLKPLDRNIRYDGLGTLLLALTMQLPIILGSLIGILIGLLAATSLPDCLFNKRRRLSLKQRPLFDDTSEPEIHQAMQSRHPYAPAGIETYKTKLMKAYQDSRKGSIHS